MKTRQMLKPIVIAAAMAIAAPLYARLMVLRPSSPIRPRKSSIPIVTGISGRDEAAKRGTVLCGR